MRHDIFLQTSVITATSLNIKHREKRILVIRVLKGAIND